MISEPLRLNLGSGDKPLAGYRNIDLGYADPKWHTGDYADRSCYHCLVYPLGGFADESVDEVRASHILEHFGWRETVDVLTEWIRVLKPGGVLKLAVPDAQWICERILRSDLTPDESVHLEMYLMGGQVDENDFHKSIFTQGALAGALMELGLVDIQRWASEIDDCASLPVSLNLMGRKPLGTEEQTSHEATVAIDTPSAGIDYANPTRLEDVLVIPGDIIAIETCPRLGYTGFQTSVFEALGRCKLSLKTHQGAFWTQGIERLLELAREQPGAKYALTLDYDSVFTAEDIQRLYAIMEVKTDIDALCPIQMRRGNPRLLNTVEGLGGEGDYRPVPKAELDKEVMPIASGHFGLTMIRLSALDGLPKPWFQEQPDPSGSWGEGRTDADIAFWRMFCACGRKAYQANRVVIGHIEEVVLFPDKAMKPMVVMTHEYQAHGKPERAWK